MAGESDMATYTGEGVGRLSPSDVRWRGAIYYGMLSTGRLAFLNNVVGVFESEVDLEGNFTDKIWEWK
jgi:hypothetical protein